jgi:hypothetical protein
MKGIGFCSHYSRQGDWAFDYAFGLAKAKDLQLSIFHWLESPYRYRRDFVYDEELGKVVPITDELRVKKELELREYYDDRLGDFVNVGFNMCESNVGYELNKCLHHGRYDLLVIGYIKKGADFGGYIIEDFAVKFRVPVVMVGPEKPNSYHLNQLAIDKLDQLNIREGEWEKI